MNEPAATSQRDQELRELRARAYGPHPDIQDDPAALERLAELESLRLGQHAPQEPIQPTPEMVSAVDPPASGAVVVTGQPEQAGSLWHKITATSSRRVWLIGGSLAVIIAVVYAGTLFGPQEPDATLQPTGLEADGRTLGAVSFAPLAEVDRTTLQGYEPYQGLQPWVAENAQGSRCILLVFASTLWGVRCAPAEAELMIDIGAWPLDPGAYSAGLADGTVIRFQLRGDSVDAYLFPPPSAG